MSENQLTDAQIVWFCMGLACMVGLISIGLAVRNMKNGRGGAIFGIAAATAAFVMSITAFAMGGWGQGALYFFLFIGATIYARYCEKTDELIRSIEREQEVA